MKSIETKEKFVELRAEGLSYALISKRLKVAKSTLINWNRELDAQICLLKDERVEAVRVKYKLHKEAQIERYGKWLVKIEKELQSRDYSDIKTDRLLDIAMKLTEELRCYEPEVIFDKDKEGAVVTTEELEFISKMELKAVN